MPVGYIWNSSFPSYFASPPNRRTILLYVAGFGMKFSLLLVLVGMPEIVKTGVYAKFDDGVYEEGVLPAPYDRNFRWDRVINEFSWTFQR